jgi:hypothetical protein
MTGGSLWDRYEAIARGAPNPVGEANLVPYLEGELSDLFVGGYQAMPRNPGELLEVTLGDRPTAFRTYLFDLATGSASGRLAAVWGVSRQEPGATRDTERERGFLSPTQSQRQKGAKTFREIYPGRDRGHAFAHTMGGEMDINFFPQLAAVNRRLRAGAGVLWNHGPKQGLNWRELEEYAAAHPSFCFIRFIYTDRDWVPHQLDYGVYPLPPEPFRFFGNAFLN